MLVNVLGDPGARDHTEVHPDVEAVRAAGSPQSPQRVLREQGHLRGLSVQEISVVSDVAVRNDHDVPGVVRVEVEDGIHNVAPRDDESFLVRHGRDDTERAGSTGRPALAFDIGHPVRRVQPAEAVRTTDPSLRLQRDAIRRG